MASTSQNGLRGKRGRKSAPLPSYAEKNADGRVRCCLCTNYNKREYKGGYILPKSFAGHDRLPCHQRAVQNEQAHAAAQRQEAADDSAASLRGVVVSNPINPNPIALESRPSAAEENVWVHSNDVHDYGQSAEQVEERNRQDFEEKLELYGLWHGDESAVNEEMEAIEQEWQEEEEDALLTELLEQVDLGGGDDVEDDDTELSEWSPYPSKVAFLLDTIDHLPRLRISSSLMKVFLWMLNEIGVKKVPSFDRLRKIQKKVRDENIVPTVHWKSPKGNAFSFNDPRAIIANDWANPLVSEHIRLYPVLPRNGVVSEIWHAEKWHRDLDRHLLSPMYDAGGGRHYYIDEPARLLDSRVVIPVRWLQDEDGCILFDAWEVARDGQTGLSTVKDDKTVLLPAAKLRENLLDLEGLNALPEWSSESIDRGHPARIPNPDRALAQGRPIYTSFIDIFGDDVSGNRSKSWNKHWNVYFAHRNLPRKFLYQQCHVHFVSTSQHASVPEQFQAVKEVIERTQKEPIKTRSAVNGQETLLKLRCNCAPGDNPSQSETCGHIGGQGNYPCRKCTVGGSQKDKETKEGFHGFFTSAPLRSSKDILAEVKKQVETACLGIASNVAALQTDSGIKDAFTQYWIEDLIKRARELRRCRPERSPADIQTELMAWVKDNESAIFNPFLTLDGFDAARDTPVELLHTILLGVVKYVWHGSHTSWNDTQKRVYADRLQATDAQGLSIPSIRANYIMQYANSLIGRQLKTLAQVNPFHVYDIVDNLRFLLTKAVGELSALLWITEIRNMDEYLSDVETAAANVLDLAALIDPSKIILKIKYHLLAHLRTDILRFGPLVGVATEIYESFNAIFRFCSILSNHLAPSRDIAIQLAEQEVLRHILSGGFWLKNGSCRRGGQAVTGFLEKNIFLQNLLGYGRHMQGGQLEAGAIRLEAMRRDGKKKIPRTAFLFADTQSATAVNILDEPDLPSLKWYKGKHVISRAQDQCHLGSWIFASSPFSTSQSPLVGKILEILQDQSGNKSYVLIDQYQIRSARHEFFGLPVLGRRLGETTLVLVRAKDILFSFNAQHDCREAKCRSSGSRTVVQERLESGLMEAFIQHNHLDRYLVNIYSFHNGHLLRAALPRDLTAPIPFSSNRQSDHFKLADRLHSSREFKRQEATGKRETAKKQAQADGRGKASKKRKRDGTPVPTDDDVDMDNR